MKRRDDDYHNIYNNWRGAEIMMTLMAMIGTALAVVIYEIDVHNWNDHLIDTSSYPNPMDHPRNSYPWINPVRMVIVATSLISIYFLILRQYYKRIWINNFFAILGPR